MRKPKSSYWTLSGENLLHANVYKYCRLMYPKVLCIHPPNEGNRTPYERWLAKQLGLTAGVPDLLIFFQRERIINGSKEIFSGLAIELKFGKNKATKAQENILNELDKNGWECHVIWDFDTAKNVIDNYLKL